MQKPNESLDDYIVRPSPEVTTDPPRPVSLQRTGEVEVLKPLARIEVRARSIRRAFGTYRPYQPLWFRRFLAVGSGALVFMAFVLVSAILVGISDPATGPEIAANANPDVELALPEEPFSFDDSSSSDLALASGAVDIIESTSGKRPARRTNNIAATRPLLELRPLPQPVEPKFVPTTLVIYAENGVINTRIELGLQASYKKPPGIIYY